MTQNTWTTLDIVTGGMDASTDILLIDSDWQARETRNCTASPPARDAGSGFEPELGRRYDLTAADGRRALALGIGVPPRTLLEWEIVGGHLYDALVDRRVPAARLPSASALGGGDRLAALLTGALLHGYRLRDERATPRPGFRPQSLVIDAEDGAAAERATRAASAVNRARASVEQSANLLTPPVWASQIAASLEPFGITVRVLDPEALLEAEMGGLLAVGRGSEHGAWLVAAEWRGAPDREGWDAAWIGKGVTFDSGGMNLKTRPVIEKMKFDMAGGAAVLAAVELAANQRTQANVVAIVAMADNAVDALSYHSGDVVRSASGLTIEVINTDAEGRIAMADAMTWARKHYAPGWMIDVATLTAMAAVVMHEEFAAVYANDDGLAAGLDRSGKASGEHVWRMPLDPRQCYLADSDVADVCNVGPSGFLGVSSGSCTAAAQFLARFTEGVKWAHIDIAGPAWTIRRAPLTGLGASGFGGRLLDAWLTDLVASGGV